MKDENDNNNPELINQYAKLTVSAIGEGFILKNGRDDAKSKIDTKFRKGHDDSVHWRSSFSAITAKFELHGDDSKETVCYIQMYSPKAERNKFSLENLNPKKYAITILSKGGDGQLTGSLGECAIKIKKL